jgi:tetratricopeptide (TPR) repeat protein
MAMAQVEKRHAVLASAGTVEHTGNKVAPADPFLNDADRKAVHEYTKLRDELMAFSLGEAAFQYAERLDRESPHNPAVMALLGETAVMYERMKNPARREHWVDRLDVLQRGIDVTRQCMKEFPDYGPCYRSYILCATKMADQEVWFRRWKPLSTFKHYNRIMAIGDRALELYPSADVYSALAGVTGRCATRIRHWYSPWRPVAWFYRVPTKDELLARSRDLHLECQELNPDSMENACRLAMVYYEIGDWNEARRWYIKVRDEMVPREPKEDIWQSVAHTHLCTHFEKTSWNVPFA